jgi:hypothetical protein
MHGVETPARQWALRGFGFAGSPAEVGLSQHSIAVALLFFNLGVEFGQLKVCGRGPTDGRLVPHRNGASSKPP